LIIFLSHYGRGLAHSSRCLAARQEGYSPASHGRMSFLRGGTTNRDRTGLVRAATGPWVRWPRSGLIGTPSAPAWLDGCVLSWLSVAGRYRTI